MIARTIATVRNIPYLPCFRRGDAALTRLKNSAISGEFLLLRSMCSHMRDGEVCVRVCSTVHEKRSAEAAIGNPGANWTVVGAADFNDDGKDDILPQGSNTGNLMLDPTVRSLTPP